ncbi:MAG: PPC domain-containing protein [Actinomycetota bacterium]
MADEQRRHLDGNGGTGRMRTHRNRRPAARACLVAAAMALTAAACGSSTSGPQAAVEVRVVDPGATDGGATDANPIADTSTDSGNGQTDQETPTDDGGSTTAFQTPDAGAETEDLKSAREELSLTPDEAPAVFDQVNEGSIDSLFGADRWTFSAEEGQLLTVNVLDIGTDCRQDVDLYLVDPLGERFDLGWIGNSGCEGQGPYRLENTGDHALEFVGGDGSIIEATTGIYRFVPSFLTERDEQPISFGVPNDGEITQLFGTDLWTFEASAGQLLTVDILSIGSDCRQDLDMYLVDPFGERTDLGWVGNGGCSGEGPWELTLDGTYALEFTGGDGGIIPSYTGAYRFIPALN